MSQSFFDRLAGRFRGRETKAAATFAGLVAQVADGKEPALEQAEAVLVDAGKSTADLAAAVDKLKARRQARAVLDKANAAPAELRRITAALEAADAKRQQAVDLAEGEHSAAVAPLLERERALERLVEDGKRAELSLRDSAHEPAELPELRRQLVQAKQQRDGLLRLAGKAQAARDAAAVAAQAFGYSDSYKENYRQEAARHQAGVEQAIATAENPAEECRRLEKKIAEVENLAALTP